MHAKLSRIVSLGFAAALVATACGPAALPTPITVIQTQVVTKVETQVVEVVNTQEVEVPVEVVVTATPEPVGGEVKVVLIGKPEEDGIDPITGAPIPGVAKLEAMFEAAYPNIDLQIINIPW